MINWRNPIIQSGLLFLGLWIGGSLAYVFAEISDNMVDNNNWTSTGDVRIGTPTDPSAITFSYQTGTVTQNINPYDHIPAGNIIDEITWDYEYKKYDNAVGCYSNCIDDTLSETVKLTDDDGTVTTPWSWSGSISDTTFTANPTQTFVEGTDWASGVDLTNIELFFSGKDNGFWAGYYGPTIRNFELIADYSEDPSYYDPIEETVENGVCDSTAYDDPDCDNYVDDCDEFYDPGCIEDGNTSYTGMSEEEYQNLGTEEQYQLADFDGTYNDFEQGIEDGTITDVGVDTNADDYGTDYGDDDGMDENDGSSNGDSSGDNSTNPSEEGIDETVEQIESLDLPSATFPSSLKIIQNSSQGFRRASKSKANQFLKSVGVNTGSFTGTEVGMVGVSFNNDPNNQSNINNGLPNTSNNNITNNTFDNNTNVQSGTTNRTDDNQNSDSVMVAEAIVTDNPIGQDGLVEGLSLSDLGGLSINNFQQPNLRDNNNWYSDTNMLEQRDIYSDQLFYKVQDIYTSTQWYK